MPGSSKEQLEVVFPKNSGQSFISFISFIFLENFLSPLLGIASRSKEQLTFTGTQILDLFPILAGLGVDKCGKGLKQFGLGVRAVLLRGVEKGVDSEFATISAQATIPAVTKNWE